jgi:hypothetical protein
MWVQAHSLPGAVGLAALACACSLGVVRFGVLPSTGPLQDLLAGIARDVSMMGLGVYFLTQKGYFWHPELAEGVYLALVVASTVNLAVFKNKLVVNIFALVGPTMLGLPIMMYGLPSVCVCVCVCVCE